MAGEISHHPSSVSSIFIQKVTPGCDRPRCGDRKAFNLGNMLPTPQIYDQRGTAFKHPYSSPQNSPKVPNTQATLPSSPLPSYSLALTISPHSLQQSTECSPSIAFAFDLETKLPNPTTTTKTKAIVFQGLDLPNNRPLGPGGRRFYSKHLSDFLFYRFPGSLLPLFKEESKAHLAGKLQSWARNSDPLNFNPDDIASVRRTLAKEDFESKAITGILQVIHSIRILLMWLQQIHY